ncbi:MAG: DUF3772 domain-containing protein, partial [Planktomarina sp.]
MFVQALAVNAQSTPVAPNYAAWESLAAQVEDSLSNSDPSDVFLTELRVQLTIKRQDFLDAQTANAARLKTVTEQLSALGAAPDDATPEVAEIAARRLELKAQADQLSVPRLRATEAFQRANGLIDEIDKVLVDRKTAILLRLGPTPADIRIWPAAFDEVSASFGNMIKGIKNAWNTPVVRQDAQARAPVIILLLAVAALLISQGRRWSERLAHSLSGREDSTSHGLSSFLVSFGQIGLPLFGVVLISLAWQNTSFFGARFELILDSVPWMAALAFGARWLAMRMFPVQGSGETPLFLTLGKRREARTLVQALGIVLALNPVFAVLNRLDRFSEETQAVISFVFIVFAGLLLFRLGQLFVQCANLRADDDDKVSHPISLRLGQGMMLIAVVSMVLMTIGYSGAANALIFPAILSVALLGALLLFFEAVRDFFAMISQDGVAAREGLIPVAVNAVLILASLPIFALIWGARVSDLTEVWTQFKSGVKLGDVQLSPGAFLGLVVVFILGYFLTRLIQRTLRLRILPKTKMDQGARNSLVSGFGYVGIFASALIAITSAGLDLSSLAIVAGALSVGIGFGLQNIVSNFVSGIILLIERPIAEGDWIEVGGNMGYVRDISVRSTRIETFDRTDVIVPNADLVSGTVTNYTRGNSVGRLVLPIGVAYGNDTRKIEEVLKPIAQNHPMVLLDPPPSVAFLGFGADSLNFEIRALLRDINFV